MNAMTTSMRQPISLRMLFSIVLGIGMLTTVAKPAAAHTYEVRPVISSHYYYRHGRNVVFPRWLKRDRNFQNWYLHSDYRHIRGANWDRLYDMYVFEMRRKRSIKQRFRGRVYVDFDQRPRRRYR